MSDWLSMQNFNMDIYNKQVFSSASSVHVPQFRASFIDSYKKKRIKQKIKNIKETAIKNQKGEERGRTGR